MDFISCLPLLARLCVLFLPSKISSMHRRGCLREGVRLNTGGARPWTAASLTACFSVRPLKISFSILAFSFLCLSQHICVCIYVCFCIVIYVHFSLTCIYRILLSALLYVYVFFIFGCTGKFRFRLPVVNGTKIVCQMKFFTN